MCSRSVRREASTTTCRSPGRVDPGGVPRERGSPRAPFRYASSPVAGPPTAATTGAQPCPRRSRSTGCGRGVRSTRREQSPRAARRHEPVRRASGVRRRERPRRRAPASTGRCRRPPPTRSACSRRPAEAPVGKTRNVATSAGVDVGTAASPVPPTLCITREVPRPGSSSYAASTAAMRSSSPSCPLASHGASEASKHSRRPRGPTSSARTRIHRHPVSVGMTGSGHGVTARTRRLRMTAARHGRADLGASCDLTSIGRGQGHQGPPSRVRLDHDRRRRNLRHRDGQQAARR